MSDFAAAFVKTLSCFLYRYIEDNSNWEEDRIAFDYSIEKLLPL